MEEKIIIRPPTSRDAPAMRDLAEQSHVLSVNSTYYYALMARHFQETSMVSESNGDLCAFLTGYSPPRHDNTLFVWQVGVGKKWLGRGLGKKLLIELVVEKQPLFLEATITLDNKPSINLFRSVARHFSADHLFTTTPFFSEEDLGAGEEAEHLMRVGPFETIKSTFMYGGTNAYI